MSEGEPPGRWYGDRRRGAGPDRVWSIIRTWRRSTSTSWTRATPAFKDPDRWTEASKLGHGGRAYKTADQWYEQLLDAEPYADPERREQLRLEASKKERKNIAFMDVTFSVPKSITVLHAAFEHQEVQGPPGR